MKFHRMYIKEQAQMKGQFMKIGFSLGTKKRKTEQTNGLKWTFDSSNSVFSSLEGENYKKQDSRLGADGFQFCRKSISSQQAVAVQGSSNVLETSSRSFAVPKLITSVALQHAKLTVYTKKETCKGKDWLGLFGQGACV